MTHPNTDLSALIEGGPVTELLVVTVATVLGAEGTTTVRTAEQPLPVEALTVDDLVAAVEETALAHLGVRRATTATWADDRTFVATRAYTQTGTGTRARHTVTVTPLSRGDLIVQAHGI